MVSTVEWAKSLGISVADTPPPLENIGEVYSVWSIKADKEIVRQHIAYTGHEIGIRAVILQGVSAAGAGVDSKLIIEWFEEQGIWQKVTPLEKEFLLNKEPSERECIDYQWRVEAEWTLLWVIGKVESLGLPTHTCDTRKLVDEIIPGLYTDIDDFLSSAVLRPMEIILAEDDRTYDLWCRTHEARHNNTELPDDLNMGVLYQRRYAFEWLDGIEAWDAIICDS